MEIIKSGCVNEREMNGLIDGMVLIILSDANFVHSKRTQ